MISRHTLYTGKIVWLDDNRGLRELVKVEKVNPKNIKVVTQSGKRWNASPFFLHEATPEDMSGWTEVLPEKPLYLGTGVRFRDGRDSHIYVILGDTSGLYRIAKLGGDGNRYIRGVSASQLEVVDLNIEASA